MRMLLLVGALCTVSSCGATFAGKSVETPAIVVASADASGDKTITIKLPKARTLTILNESAVIKDRGGKTVAENRHLIRVPNERGNCPSRGFIDSLTEEKGFTIHQQQCSGWHFIDETLKFRFTSQEQYLLREVVLRYIDRRSPENDDVVKVLTPIDFGLIEFEKVQLDQLYKSVRD